MSRRGRRSESSQREIAETGGRSWCDSGVERDLFGKIDEVERWLCGDWFWWWLWCLVRSWESEARWHLGLVYIGLLMLGVLKRRWKPSKR